LRALRAPAAASATRRGCSGASRARPGATRPSPAPLRASAARSASTTLATGSATASPVRRAPSALARDSRSAAHAQAVSERVMPPERFGHSLLSYLQANSRSCLARPTAPTASLDPTPPEPGCRSVVVLLVCCNRRCLLHFQICEPCASGRFSTANAAQDCQPCELPSGSLHHLPMKDLLEAETTSLPFPGRVGAFQNLTGQTVCVECPVERFSNTQGQESCARCPGGRRMISAVC
jgi:hypothetical protein